MSFRAIELHFLDLTIRELERIERRRKRWDWDDNVNCFNSAEMLRWYRDALLVSPAECDHCGWRGTRPDEDVCPQCNAPGRLHVYEVIQERSIGGNYLEPPREEDEGDE